MKSLGATISDLRRQTRQIQLLTASGLKRSTPAKPDRLVELENFGSNPGNLRAWRFVPQDLKPGGALIVVLHGCDQCADDYDKGAGWSARAADLGAAILYPEQKPANNGRMCFNWFSPPDISPTGGEADSIRQMILSMVAAHRLAPSRVYVTGLSAGGAMAAALLAIYPDLFAGGAIFAGLPYGCASNALEALKAMSSGASHWADIAAAPENQGRRLWPRVSIWHGLSDAVVSPENGSALVDQWLATRNLSKESGERLQENELRTVWRDGQGRPAVEQILVPDLGHGTPIDAREAGASASRYMLDVGLDSSLAIARTWGLARRGGAYPTPTVAWAAAALGAQARRLARAGWGLGRKTTRL